MKTCNMTYILVPVAGAALATVVACGSEAPPTAEEYDDVATSIAAAVADGSAGEMEAVEDSLDAAQGEVPPGLTREGQGAVVGRRGGLDYDFSVACLDAGGASQEMCDATTDQAELALRWRGEVDTARYDATVVRTADWRLTGLQSDFAELNGAGTFAHRSEFIALFRSEMRTYRFDYDAAYDAVQIRTSDGRPVGGTVRYSVQAERTASSQFREVERTFNVTAEVIFRDDLSALVEIDGQRTYQVDVTTGDVDLVE